MKFFKIIGGVKARWLTKHITTICRICFYNDPLFFLIFIVTKKIIIVYFLILFLMEPGTGERFIYMAGQEPIDNEEPDIPDDYEYDPDYCF